MKSFRFIYLFAAIIFAVSTSFSATSEVFDGTAGMAGWSTIGSGTAYDPGNGGAVKPFKDMVTFISPASTNDYGVDGATWGWDVFQIKALYCQPISKAYVGYRYEAPAGTVITEVKMPKTYTAVSNLMHLQIADDSGVVAELTPVSTTSLNALNVSGLSAASIEIRWVNSHTSTINLWANNGIIVKTIEVVTDIDPDYTPYSPITYENPNKPQKWFGYYHAYTVVQEGQPLSSTNYGNAFAYTGSYTNLNYVFPKQGAIDAAVANHAYMLVDVMWQLFVSDGAGGFDLKSDYQTQVQNLVTLFAGYEDYIGAITPIDEPYHRNVSQAELEAAIAALKAAFPGIPIYVNFAPTIVYGLTSQTLPAGADWLAFDLYESNGQPVNIADIQGMVNHLKSIKLPEQKLFLVPPSAKNLQATYTDQQLADAANAFYGLMISDPEIIGMMVFPADGCRQVVFDGIGSTIPLALAAQQAIGAEIAGEVCGDIWNGLYKFDYNRDCQIDIIDWAGFAARWIAE